MSTKFTDSKRYNDKTLAELAKGGFVYENSVSEEVNTHSMLAAGRAALEALACRGKRKVWDVGGHRTRHDLNKRTVHCTQPMLTPVDRMAGDCTHTALQCSCIHDFDVIILVHSAYYLTEEEMWKLADAARLRSAPLYSVEHSFTLSAPVGRMDEANFRLFYTRSGRLSVSFEADETYEHPLPSWFLQERIVSIRDDEALVRSFKSTFGSTVLVSYGVVALETLPEARVKLQRHWLPQMWNILPGLVSVRRMVKSDFEFTDVRGGYQADFSQSNAYTAFCEGFPVLGKYLQRWWPCEPSQIWPVVVPKELVSYLQNNVNSKTTTGTLVELAGAWCRQNPGKLVDGVSIELIKEVAAQKAFCQDRQLIEAMRTPWVTHNLSIALGSLLATAVVIYWHLRWAWMRLFHKDPPRYLVFLAWRLLSCLTYAGVIAAGYKLFDVLRSKAISTVTKFQNRLVLRKCVDSVEDVESCARRSIPGSVLSLPDPARQKPRYFAQVVPPFHGLQVQTYNTSAHNTTVAVIGRFLKPKPVSEQVTWDTTLAVVAELVRVAGENPQASPMPEAPHSYEHWILSRPLPKQRKNYALALKRLLDSGIRNSTVDTAGPNWRRGLSTDMVKFLQKGVDDNPDLSPLLGGGHHTPIDVISVRDLKSIKGWDLKKAFVKVEKTFVLGKLPRVIIAADDVFQVFCGPEIHRFDEALQTLYSNAAQMRINCSDGVSMLPVMWFVVGWSQGRLSREMNIAIDRAASWYGDPEANGTTWSGHVTIFVLGDDNITVFCDRFGEVFVMCNDFSSYDTTHSSNSWAAQQLQMEACGVRQEVVDVIRATTENIRVTTVQHGGLFIAHWNMCSGNPNTCNGNSSITMAVSVASVVEFSEAYEEDGADQLTAFFRQLGFEPKVKVGRVGEGDFLSGIFVTTPEGRYVWIPKVFRLAVKACYVADPRPGFTSADYQAAFVESYRRFDFIPVIRALIKLFRRLSSGADPARVRVIVDNDRNLWYSPNAEDVEKGDIDVSFCEHYGIFPSTLRALEDWIESWDSYDHSVVQQNIIFYSCFLQDVPDHVQ